MELKPRLFEVEIARIDPPTRNPRFKAQDLEELVESIRGVGILEPIIGVISPGNRVRLVAGKRRLAAAVLAELRTVPVLLHAQLDERQERAVALIENLHRKDQSIIETGDAFIELSKTPMTQAQIGKMVGVSTATVSRAMLVATKAIAEVRDACHAGEITAQRAYDLAMLPSRMQKALLHQRVREAEYEDAHPSVSSGGGGGGGAPRIGKGQVETLLTAAIAAVKSDDVALAIETTEQALEVLRKKTERSLHAVG